MIRDYNFYKKKETECVSRKNLIDKYFFSCYINDEPTLICQVGEQSMKQVFVYC